MRSIRLSPSAREQLPTTVCVMSSSQISGTKTRTPSPLANPWPTAGIGPPREVRGFGKHPWSVPESRKTSRINETVCEPERVLIDGDHQRLEGGSVLLLFAHLGDPRRERLDRPAFRRCVRAVIGTRPWMSTERYGETGVLSNSHRLNPPADGERVSIDACDQNTSTGMEGMEAQGSSGIHDVPI